jgi:hypothetical protein
MKKLQLSDFKTYSKKELEYFTEFSDDYDLKFYEVEGLQYVKIHNLLKRPEELKEFLVQFPTEDRTKSLIEEDESNATSKAPGFQQPIESKFLIKLGKNLFDIIKKNCFCKYNYEQSTWEYYTNCCYPNMPSYNMNYLPHVDPFSYACNIFLTDVPNTGTSFFKYESKNKTYYSSAELLRNAEDTKIFGESYMKKGVKSGIDKWVAFDGDDMFTRYHHITADYNSCSIYRGNRWHSIYYDAENSTDIRYSLVAVIK